MELQTPVKKLFKTSFYASCLIGVLAFSTHAVMGSAELESLFHLAFFVALLVFFISVMNIGIVHAMLSFKRLRITPRGRYFLSFFVGSVLILAFNFLFLHLTNGVLSKSSPAINQVEFRGIHLQPYAILILFISLNSIILLIHDLVLLRDKKSKVEVENAELKYKNIESTYQLLKNQIHPHFLFNSLSTLKSLIKKQPDIAEEYVIRLSDYLRASMQSDFQNLVNLDEELKLCANYVNLQKLRFGNSFTFTNTIPNDLLGSVYIPPFSILSLIENAIKHNKFTEESPLQITLIYERDRLIVKNNKNAVPKLQMSSGLGLQNLNSRYKILSGDEIIIDEGVDFFSVSIKVLENESSNSGR